MKEHQYRIDLKWTGNLGSGTNAYRSYSRDHVITAAGKSQELPATSDPAFRGDPTRYNPEELLVASLSGCHMLWYLHLCAVNRVTVVDYVDTAEGTMVETDAGGGHFSEVTLRPIITVSEAGMVEKALTLHEEAHRHCFIANSMNFPVRHEPEIRLASEGE